MLSIALHSTHHHQTMAGSVSLQSQPLVAHNLKRHSTNHLNSKSIIKHTVRCVAVERQIDVLRPQYSRPMPSMASPKMAPLQRYVSLASMWREIQGSNDWHNLINPLNHVLRDEIIRYGGLVCACYKAFDLDHSSNRFLNCKYGKASMLREVGMAASGYEITKYIYAAPGISMPVQQGDDAGRSRWIGYIAVSTDDETMRIGRRDILVSFRGTVTCTEWLANLMSSLTPARFDPTNHQPDVKVESGFLSLYTSDDHTCKFGQGSCREQLLKEVTRLINQYKGEELSVTLAGHSMGSSLAILFGYDLTELGLNWVSSQAIPVTVYSFGGPRVGNSKFKERCDDLGLKVLRVVNTCDPITKLPGVIMNEGMRMIGEKYELPWTDSCYTHVGAELCMDFFKLENPRCVHDMETYIGLLKCSMTENVGKNEEPGLLEKAKEMVARNKTVHSWSWQDAARQVGDLVQSLGF